MDDEKKKKRGGRGRGKGPGICDGADEQTRIGNEINNMVSSTFYAFLIMHFFTWRVGVSNSYMHSSIANLMVVSYCMHAYTSPSDMRANANHVTFDQSGFCGVISSEDLSEAVWGYCVCYRLKGVQKRDMDGQGGVRVG